MHPLDVTKKYSSGILDKSYEVCDQYRSKTLSLEGKKVLTHPEFVQAFHRILLESYPHLGKADLEALFSYSMQASR